MNKWYRSGLAKGILIVIAHVLVVLSLVSFWWIAAYPGVAQDMLSSGKGVKSYEDSKGFYQQVYQDSLQILHGIAVKDMLETDGKYDEKKIVDIKDYNDNYAISGENKNGLAYYLGDLNKWYEAAERSDGVDFESVIVCQKQDGSFDYYYYKDFLQKVQKGELSFLIQEDGYTLDDILDMLQNEQLVGGASGLGTPVLDSDGAVKYENYWNYSGAYEVEDKYAPVGADSILDIVNNDPQWNGKLEELMERLHAARGRIASDVVTYKENQEDWAEGNTNLAYIYADKQAKKVYTNHAEYGDFQKLDENLKKLKETGKYVVVMPKLADFDTNMNGAAKDWKDEVKATGTTQEDFVFAVAVDSKLSVPDNYHTQSQLYHTYAPKIKMISIMGLLSVVGFLIVMIWLTAVAGRNQKDEELHLHGFDRWKTELAAAVVCVPWFGLMFVCANISIDSYTMGSGQINTETLAAYYSSGTFIVAAVIAALTCMAFMVGYLSLVRRLKARTLWKNSILYSLLRFIVQLFRHMREVWKVVLIFAGFVLFHWLFIGSGFHSGLGVMLLLAAEVMALVYLVRRAIGRQKIRRGIERIAAGEVNYKIPLYELRGEQQIIAERVNAIGEGLDAAVEASIKNERLKTDLITNVSHDIKTPLTSIINYIALLRRENFTDPKILGYLDVLEAKALRLKTLTEDVVEASKVSSGNISLEFMNINLVEMIQQTSGEFEEKFRNRNLKEVLSLPDEEAVVRVDGRRMWRVLENIYNNAAKYAMEGTRVYADLGVTEGEVIFSLKNVSEQPLNINADELTERFIRGDVSRSTEGSGLGLSIAKTLTEMQNGKFEIYLDGDLFRVTITFPRLVKMHT